MRISACRGWLLCLVVSATAGAQTRVDLKSQSKSVDFSGVATKPFQTGTALPATCSPGQTFFKTDAPPGKNFYGCTAPNIWALQAFSSLPDVAGQSGKLLTNDGATAWWSVMQGDVAGSAAALTVQGLQGRKMSAAAPAQGQALEWNGTTAQWEPATIMTAIAGDASGPLYGAVVQGLQGRPVSATKPTDGQALVWSAAAGQWQPASEVNTLTGDASGPTSATVVRALQGRAVATTAPADGQALQWSAAAGQWQPATSNTTLSGDASGPTSATVVKALQGRAVATTAPTDGQALEWSATLNQWQPGNATGTLGGDVSGPSNSLLVKGLQGHSLSAVTPSNGQGLKWNGTLNEWEPGDTTLIGDASGPSGATVVGALQGRRVAAMAPNDGQLLRWNAISNQWEPGQPAVNYSSTFTSQTSLVIPASAHGFNTSNLIVQCYDGAGSVVLPYTIAIDNATYDVTITFTTAQSGRCVVNGSTSTGSSGGGGTSGVTSVFERTGIVAAQTGDYSFGQITGTVSNSQLGTGIDAGKIGAGTVSTTAFGYLANVQSDIQAQVDAKAALSHSHTARGDVAGDLSATVVTGVQGQPVAALQAADGNVLTWAAARGQWEPQPPKGGGTVSGLSVALSNATSLSIGGDCTPTSPCNVRFGNLVQSIQAPATATIAGGSGLAFIYVNQYGQIVVGHSMTVSCPAGCQAQAGITNFPYDVIPIATWGATNGTWDSQGTDWRAYLSTNVLNAGEGIVTIEAAGTTTIAVDTAVVPTYVAGSATLDFPSISNGTCAADVGIAVPGATVGNAVAPGWPSTLQPGVIGTMYVSATNTVSVRLCNFSGLLVDPAPAVYTATIIRSF